MGVVEALGVGVNLSLRVSVKGIGAVSFFLDLLEFYRWCASQSFIVEMDFSLLLVNEVLAQPDLVDVSLSFQI